MSGFSDVMLQKKGAYLKLKPTVGLMEKFCDPKNMMEESYMGQDEKNSEVEYRSFFIFLHNVGLDCHSFQMAVFTCQFFVLFCFVLAPVYKKLPFNFMNTRMYYYVLSRIFQFYVETLQVKCLDFSSFLVFIKNFTACRKVHSLQNWQLHNINEVEMA